MATSPGNLPAELFNSFEVELVENQEDRKDEKEQQSLPREEADKNPQQSVDLVDRAEDPYDDEDSYDKLEEDSRDDEDKFKLLKQLECSICLELLCDPVTCPCGHNFCRSCLLPALKTNASCPLCRAPCHISDSRPENKQLAQMCRILSPQHYDLRLRKRNALLQPIQADLPVFLSGFLPQETLDMYFFEPRYKIMSQRIANTRRFLYLPTSGVDETLKGDVGVLMNVDNIRFLADGRALVRCSPNQRVLVLKIWIEDGTQGLRYATTVPYTGTEVPQFKRRNTRCCSHFWKHSFPVLALILLFIFYDAPSYAKSPP